MVEWYEHPNIVPQRLLVMHQIHYGLTYPRYLAEPAEVGYV